MQIFDKEPLAHTLDAQHRLTAPAGSGQWWHANCDYFRDKVRLSEHVAPLCKLVPFQTAHKAQQRHHAYEPRRAAACPARPCSRDDRNDSMRSDRPRHTLDNGMMSCRAPFQALFKLVAFGQ